MKYSLGRYVYGLATFGSGICLPGAADSAMLGDAAPPR